MEPMFNGSREYKFIIVYKFNYINVINLEHYESI